MAILSYIVFIILAGVAVKLIQYYRRPIVQNPFAKDARLPIKKKIHDQKIRDTVLKNGFSMAKVPKELDAIIIGSGIGGLTTAALMSKAGKKVLVLEQHDQAGGCCHTFIEKGYEFDVGIHYVGDMIHESMTHTLVDQISHGQITWQPMEEAFDKVVFNEPNKPVRCYDIHSDYEQQKQSLKKYFPDDHAAIDRFYELAYEVEKCHNTMMVVKFLPVWLVKCVQALNLMSFVSKYFSYNQKTVKQVVDELTTNEELRDVFCYCFGDYGTPPSVAGFPMQALLVTHFQKGRAGYPIGGASEIAYNIIPVIEESGGKVLVRAEVEKIMVDESGTAHGVQVKHGQSVYHIFAPIIISNAGAHKTLSQMLPAEIGQSSPMWPVFSEVSQGVAAMSVFVGLDATAEQLEICKRKNMWVFTKNNIDKTYRDYLALDKDEFEDKDIPLMFLSFPSTKDPLWEDKYPGKTTVAMITMASYEWFSEWSQEPCKRRSDDYEARKKSIGQKCIDQLVELFPKTKDHIDYVNIGTPVTNNFYLGGTNGEIYGLDHSQARFSAINTSLLRPDTHIKGLYLTGQDICSGGFVGGLYGGLVCAQQILKRNVLKDLVGLYKATKKSE